MPLASLPKPQEPLTREGQHIQNTWYMALVQLITNVVDVVIGPASSLNNQIVLFNGTTGKLIKGATGTGFVFATNGVYSVVSDISQVGYWSELTNGDPVSPELVFDSFGDTIDVWVPTP